MSNFNLEHVKSKLVNVDDVMYKEIKCGNQLTTLVFVDSLNNSELMSEFIIYPLLNYDNDIDNSEQVIKEIIGLGSAAVIEKLDEALMLVLNGGVLLFFTSFNDVICCDAKGYSIRGIDTSVTETVVKGPREGFVESLETNISAIRRRIRTPALKIEKFYLGKKSKTPVAMLYLEGCTPEELVEHIRSKILSLNRNDFVFYTNTLEEQLKARNTPFDTIGYTEKPDIASTKLAEGKVVVIFDGTPFFNKCTFFLYRKLYGN